MILIESSTPGFSGIVPTYVLGNSGPGNAASTAQPYGKFVTEDLQIAKDKALYMREKFAESVYEVYRLIEHIIE